MTATGFASRHREVGTVLDYHVEVDGDNPFGRVKDAWLKIEAPLVPLKMSETTGMTGNMLLKTENDDTEGTMCGLDTIDRSYAVSGDAVRDMRLYALILAVILGDDEGIGSSGGHEGKGPIYMGIVVRESGREGAMQGAMERIGWTFLGPHDFGPGELEARTTVTLI